MNASAPLVTLSVVSHGQSTLVEKLLSDLDRLGRRDFEVVVTSNLPESEASYVGRSYAVTRLKNSVPKGFGANHNAAFEHSRGLFFVVVNPDIRLSSLDIDRLLMPFDDPNVGGVAPKVVSSDGRLEDSARRFPTVWRLLCRLLLRRRAPDYALNSVPVDVDWAAGMFVVFRPEMFKALGGFDDRRFFMYFEDVDICRRLHQRGWRVVVQPAISVVHDAQRASHRSLMHLRWHLTSAVRFLTGL